MNIKELDVMIRYCHALIAIKEMISKLPDPESSLEILEAEKSKIKLIESVVHSKSTISNILN